jgi:Spy/CpxP family protein refolding chaperone
MKLRQNWLAVALVGSAMAVGAPLFAALLFSAPLFAQQGPPPQGGPGGPGAPPPPPPPQRGRPDGPGQQAGEQGPPPRRDGRGENGPPPPPRADGPGRGPTPLGALEAGQHGRWWANRALAEKIGLSDDQVKKMDDIFQHHRIALVDLDASVRKAELTLEPLLSAEQPDEAKIVAQIDRSAQARAELEKSHARVLLAIRRVMTADQWKKLKEDAAAHRPGGRGPQPPPPPPVRK